MNHALGRFFRTRKIAILCLSGIAITAVFFLAFELKKDSHSGSGPAYATVVRVSGEARYKAAGAFAWKPLAAGSELRAKDTLSTAENSSLLIRTQDGKQIELEPNSFVVIESKNLQNLSLLRGAFVLRQSDGKKDTRISRGNGSAEDVRELLVRLVKPQLFSHFYVAPGGTYKVSFSWSEIQTEAKASILQISKNREFKGEAPLEIQRKQGTNELYGNLGPANYYWRVLDESRVPLSETGQFSVLEAQAAQTRYPIGKTFLWDKGLKFSFILPRFETNSSDTTINHFLEISSDSKFSNILNRSEIPSQQNDLTLENLSEGSFYWRIRSNIDGVSISSNPELVQLERARLLSIETISPADDSVFAASTPLRFEWKSNADEAQYQLRFRSLSNSDTKEFTTTENFINIDSLPAGNYEWAVSAKRGKFSAESKPRKISVLESGKFALIKPRRGEQIIPRTESGSFIFEWEKNSEADSYQVEIAVDRSFENKIAVKAYSSPRASSDDLVLSSLDQYYYWRVIALKANRRLTMSEIGEFRYGTQFEIGTPTLLSPAPAMTINPIADGKAARFTWSPVKNADGYEFSLFDASQVNSETKSAILRGYVKNTYYEAPNIGEGRFTWSVRAVHKNKTGSSAPARLVNVSFGSLLRAPASKSQEVQ